ncbi:hypothetical protein J2T13_004084 [Paenibacillus sp. DS2015]
MRISRRGIIELLFIVFIMLYILRRCIKTYRDGSCKKVYIALGMEYSRYVRIEHNKQESDSE